MDKTVKTRDFYLICLSAIYLIAFTSIFSQIPGLYGRNGILPASTYIKSIKEQNPNLKNAESLFMHTPSLVWFTQIDTSLALELISLFGVVLSLLCMIFQKLRTLPVFLFLWLCYLSIYKVGQTFMWFQWDILLLEAGFISIFVAPLANHYSDQYTGIHLHKQLAFWLVKWLLFRLMFASGIVKLTSKCPTWWNLTALNYHYESQCIPTPLAWWAHQLPHYIQQLSTIATYIIEILLPFLFFCPLRCIKLMAGYAQVFLMFMIFLTGNYNFFNILTVVLCLSLIDDYHLEYLSNMFSLGGKPEVVTKRKTKDTSSVVKVLNSLVLFGLLYICSQLFSYKKNSFKLNFTDSDLEEFLAKSLPWIYTIAVSSFCVQIISIILSSLQRNMWGNLVKLVMILIPCACIFTTSLVPFSSGLEQEFSKRLPSVAHKWYANTHNFEIAHSYGLFRRMTGVGGRPEVIIEGANTRTGVWKEINFLYKPGNTTGDLPWAVPHQPRLDWQMWFAALGSYQHSTWMLSLLHRILTGSPEVLNLLDASKFAFHKRPPKYIRAKLYHYHYTRITSSGSVPKNVWRREFQKEYAPLIDKDDTGFQEFLKFHKLMPVKRSRKAEDNDIYNQFLRPIRSFVSTVQPHVLIWSLLIAVLCIKFVRKWA